jgi:putative Holliday junction resolvase
VRYLAIDLGERRTGLAVGDDATGLAEPYRVVEVKRRHDEVPDLLLRAVREAIDDHGAGALVVGLPLNMDDSEGAQAKAARVAGDAIGAAVGLPVHYQDERLTSAEADWAMAQSGMTRKQKKQLRDALAAAAILRDFLGGHA